jgi:hypothetical protein
MLDKDEKIISKFKRNKVYLGFNDYPSVSDIDVSADMTGNEEFIERLLAGNDAYFESLGELVESGKIAFNEYRLLRRTYVRVVYFGAITAVLLIIIIVLYEEGELPY